MQGIARSCRGGCRVQPQKKGGENLRLSPLDNLIPESSGLQMIPNTWRRTGDHYAHAREGTLERGDTRRHPRQRKGSFLPGWMTSFCYLFFLIFPLCVGNGVGKEKHFICLVVIIS